MGEVQHKPRDNGDRRSGQAGSGPRLFHADYVVAAVFFVFCAVVLYLTTTFEEVPPSLAQGMQPADFPRLVVAVIVLLNILMIVQARGTADKKRAHVPPIVYLTILAMIGFLVIAQWLDLLIAIFTFCVMLPPLWGDRRYTWVAVFAVTVPVAIFVLFSIVLEVRFPRGIVINLLY